MRDIERVLKRRGFVRNRRPRTPIALRGIIPLARIEASIRQPRGQETLEYRCRIDAQRLVVPAQLPSRTAPQILLHVIRRLALRHLRERKVVQAVLDRPRNAPLVPILTYVAQRLPVVERGAAFFVFKAQVGEDFGVLAHRGVPVLPVDAGA